jgi:hypothetical protein
MLLFAQAGAGQLVESQLASSAASPLLTAYGLRGDAGAIKVAAFKKDADRGARLAIEAGQHSRGASVLRLVAPRLDDTEETTFGGAPVGAGGAWSATREEMLRRENEIWTIELPAASAALITFERRSTCVVSAPPNWFLKRRRLAGAETARRRWTLATRRA